MLARHARDLDVVRRVEALTPHTLCLAVLDVRLGRESGLDLLRHVLEVRRTLATILVSANPGYRDDFAAWLADAFLDKTHDPLPLTVKVGELLALHAA